MDADTTTPDLDIGPAVAKLRFFRFAEYVLVFLAIVAVPIAADLYMLGDEAEDLRQQFGSGFSSGALTLAIIALGVAIAAGILTYRAASDRRSPREAFRRRMAGGGHELDGDVEHHRYVRGHHALGRLGTSAHHRRRLYGQAHHSLSPGPSLSGLLAKLLAQEAKGGHRSALSAHQGHVRRHEMGGGVGVAEPETIICARLGADGTIAFTRSRRRSKDAYDLAAKVAHLGILGPDPRTLDHEPNGVPAAP